MIRERIQLMTTWFSRGRLQQFMPYVTSLLIHGVIVLCLAMWVLPMLTEGIDIHPIEAAFTPRAADAQTKLTQESVEFSAVDSPQRISRLMTTEAAESTRPPAPDTPARLATPQTPRLFSPSLPAVNQMRDEDMVADIPIMMAAMPVHRHRGVTRVAEAEDTQAIARSLQGDLMSISSDGDALIVWMLDQSLSMQLDMKELAQGLLGTLQEIARDKSTNMQHYVVAFGDGAAVIRNASDRGTEVAQAIYNLPPDPSGIENTFQSVEWCIDNLFRAPRWLRGKQRQKLLVIWTDESGDDYLRLEHTIQRCREANVRVDIIGPSAVLGAQTGYTRYLHPADQRVYYLPVHRGPDSSFPQKLSLGYWHRGVPRGFDESFRGPYQGLSPKWQGGSNMVSMLSGFSPYALTRLARETGGRYTIYDRAGDRPPFRLEQIKDYSPDYRSIAEIGFALQRQPLRQLVLAASAVTWRSPNTRDSEPPLVFRPQRGGEQGVQYRRTTLPDQLRPAISRAFATARDVESALSIYAHAATSPGFQPRQNYSEPEIENNDPPDPVSGEEVDGLNVDAERPAPAADTRPDAQKPREDEESPPSAIDDDESKERDVATEVVDIAAITVEVNESLLEQLYHREDSARWRAWCDLNMGRLLAVSVRLREYLTVATGLLNNINGLNPETNYVRLDPSANLVSGRVSVMRLALARRLLERCIEQNPGTPWAIMAERELRDNFGLQLSQRFIPPPKPSPRRSTPSPPRPALPNL